jgi:hypothetical protein
MVRTTMFLGIAFTEALALFGFVLAFIISAEAVAMRTRTLLARGSRRRRRLSPSRHPALAQEPPGEAGSEELTTEARRREANGATEADPRCIDLLIDGVRGDDCQEAPNPILPATNEHDLGRHLLHGAASAARKFACRG